MDLISLFLNEMDRERVQDKHRAEQEQKQSQKNEDTQC